MAAQNFDGAPETGDGLRDQERAQGIERASADETPTVPHTQGAGADGAPTQGVTQQHPTPYSSAQHPGTSELAGNALSASRENGGYPQGVQPGDAQNISPQTPGRKRIGVSVLAAVLSLVGAFVLGGAGGATVAAGLTSHSSERSFGNRQGGGPGNQHGGPGQNNGTQNDGGSNSDGGMPGGSNNQNGGPGGQNGTVPGNGQNAPGQGGQSNQNNQSNQGNQDGNDDGSDS